MASAGTLIFDLAADVAHLRRDMQKANDTIISSLKSIQNAAKSIAVMQGAEYAMEFARGFAEGIKSAIDQADELGKLAARIGTTTEELSALNYAAEFAGVTTDDLTVGFKGLNKALLESRDPMSASAAAFKALGLNAQQLRSMDPGAAFEEIAQAVSGFADGAEKAAVMTQLFGKQGQALIPLMNGGKEGLKDAREEAEKLGLIISSQTAAAMEALNDDLTRLQKVSEGAFAVIARQLTPALDTLVSAIFSSQQETSAWNDMLTGAGTIISDLIIDLTQLAGEISIAWRELQGYGAAAKQFFAGEFKAALDTTRAAMDKSNADMDALVTKMGDAKKLQRDMANNPIDFGNASASWDDKPVVKFSAALDANAKAGKKVKQAVDEYAQMLKALQEELRRTTANGDDMQMLLTDPKFLTFTKQQQQQLIAIKEQSLALAAAQEAQKKAQDDLAKAADDAQKELDATVKSLQDFSNSELDSIDPTREYVRTIEKLIAAQNEGMITADEFAKLQQQAADKMIDAGKKGRTTLDDLKQAIDGFGKQSSDALVEFMFATDKTAQSFSEMVSSMLKDIAKMLVYKNVFEPLIGGISAGATSGSAGGFLAAIMSAFGGNRMAGGPVSPGQYYSINETPLRGEYFVPNVPGRITTGTSDGSTSIVINVNTQTGETGADADGSKAVELAKRIAMIVRQVIATEKRTGGLLAS
ncbi:hypothetical protein HDG32_005521 [Paraburkholderia sp. CI2]|uniref:hypothetical protein n=1 Tax=Paraburkholderia sp. CI2 TaxID=2723093 RepID=UPI00161E3003|nr:hypothetical protein [Paraburkholderia sp. CI2]MBB5469374.1 hypothetical protein [Paraburkholderia sp. CI2]